MGGLEVKTALLPSGTRGEREWGKDAIPQRKEGNLAPNNGWWQWKKDTGSQPQCPGKKPRAIGGLAKRYHVSPALLHSVGTPQPLASWWPPHPHPVLLPTSNNSPTAIMGGVITNTPDSRELPFP